LNQLIKEFSFLKVFSLGDELVAKGFAEYVKLQEMQPEEEIDFIREQKS